MFSKTIVSKNNSQVKITLDLPDETPNADILALFKKIQEFVDGFESLEDFESFMQTHTENWDIEMIH